jgi:hypothetical protein
MAIAQEKVDEGRDLLKEMHKEHFKIKKEQSPQAELEPSA